jgi:phosphoribosylamine-glycine ligase
MFVTKKCHLTEKKAFHKQLLTQHAISTHPEQGCVSTPEIDSWLHSATSNWLKMQCALTEGKDTLPFCSLLAG